MDNKKTLSPMQKRWIRNLWYYLSITGETQEQFASRFDDDETDSRTDARALRRYLNGQIPHVSKLVCLARSLGVTVDSLVCETIDNIFKRRIREIWKTLKKLRFMTLIKHTNHIDLKYLV